MEKNNIDETKKLAIASHLLAITQLLGIDETESNKDTPKRIAKMWYDELFESRNDIGLEELDKKMTLFEAEGIQSPVEMSGIKFSSVCEHHWMPFFGTVKVTYMPKDTIIGLSKIPRVVKYFSKRPQLQERLTKDIGEYLAKVLDPKYLFVEVEALHTCVMCRGAESECNTKTYFNYTEPFDGGVQNEVKEN